MVYGIIVGAGAGMTITTLLYAWMLIRANRQSREDSKVIEALLIRKAEASEMIAENLAACVDSTKQDGEAIFRTHGDNGVVKRRDGSVLRWYTERSES